MFQTGDDSIFTTSSRNIGPAVITESQMTKETEAYQKYLKPNLPTVLNA